MINSARALRKCFTEEMAFELGLPEYVGFAQEERAVRAEEAASLRTGGRKWRSRFGE